MIAAISLPSRRVFKTLALWLGLAALMVQNLAPLCAAGLMGGPSDGVASVVICTVHGYETVAIDSNGKPLPSGPAKNASDCCTACAAPNGFTTPSPILVAVPVSVAFMGARVLPLPVIAPRIYSSYITRAPPAAISFELA